MTLILNDEEVDVSALLDVDYVCMFEIVDGAFIVEKLDEYVSTDLRPA